MPLSRTSRPLSVPGAKIGPRIIGFSLPLPPVLGEVRERHIAVMLDLRGGAGGRLFIAPHVPERVHDLIGDRALRAVPGFKFFFEECGHKGIACSTDIVGVVWRDKVFG
jgi:hypothetical protein